MPSGACQGNGSCSRQNLEDFLHHDTAKIRAAGAHGIPLLTHAALSGNVALVEMLVERGAAEGMSYAVNNAVTKGHVAMTRWLLEHGQPDLGWKNFQEKTALAVAVEKGDETIAGLLREHGALA